MGSSRANTREWSVAPAPVTTEDAANLLRDYYIEVADRYRLLHYGRRSTTAEIDTELADICNDDLTPPRGLFLLGRLDGIAAACAGLRILEPETVELTRVFVRPPWRGTGGGARLLDAVELCARALGAHQIVLDTRLDLIEARTLYRNHGYREIPAYNQDEYAEAWFGKELDPVLNP